MSPPRPVRRVLILVENLPVPFDRRVWMEALTLREAGYEVSVICPKGKGYEKEYEEIHGIHIYRYSLPEEGRSAKSYLREYALALWHTWRLSWRVLRERGFDVIHACNPPDLFFLVGLPFKLWGKRFLFDHHDLNPELYEAKFGRRDIFYRLLLLLERLTFMAADVVIATNESYREVALTRGRKRPDQVFVVRSGPRLHQFKPVSPNPMFKRGRRYLVGYVGVMGEQDGVDYLLRAVREIVHTHGRRDVHFVLIGSGPMFNDLQRMAGELAIKEFVEFTGRVPDNELLARLSTCDVCVNPDPLNPLNDKSTMNKILEYMALGKPIVQFDLLEGRRSAGEASLYATPNSPSDLARLILELLDDEPRRHSLGREGRRRIEEELAWEHQAPKLLAAYKYLFGCDVPGKQASPDHRLAKKTFTG